MAQIDVRTLKPGEKLDNIPLLTCPVCGKTAFSLGPTRYADSSTGPETFAHVVDNLTRRSGDIIESCDFIPG